MWMQRNMTILFSVATTGYLGRFLSSSIGLVLLQVIRSSRRKGSVNLLCRLFFLHLGFPQHKKKQKQNHHQEKELHLSSQATVCTVFGPPRWLKMTKCKSNSSPMILDNGGFKIPHSLKADFQY